MGIGEGEHPPRPHFNNNGGAPISGIGVHRSVEGFHERVLQIAVDGEFHARTVDRIHAFGFPIRYDGAASGGLHRQAPIGARKRIIEGALNPSLPGRNRVICGFPDVTEHVSGHRTVGVFAFHELFGFDSRNSQRVDFPPFFGGNIPGDIYKGGFFLTAQEGASQFRPIYAEQRCEYFRSFCRPGAFHDELVIGIQNVVPVGIGLVVPIGADEILVDAHVIAFH